MAVPGARLDGIKRVLSHPVALGQCRIWLAEHLPDVELVSAWDTAGSAELVAQEGNPALAAIAARHAADAHGLVPLAERIEDDPTNQTRFLTFTRSDAPALPAGSRRHQPLQDLAHRADRPQAGDARAHAAGLRRAGREPDGAAVAARSARRHGPTASTWTSTARPPIPGVAEALEEVEALAARVVVLGSYEAWVEGSRLSAPPPTPAHHTRKPDVPLVDRRRVPEGSRVQVGTLTFGGERAGADRRARARSRARR